ncbi:MAG: amino acid permease [Ilumatobacteraceae bacterium]
MNVKRILIGRPLATYEEEHQRLRKRIALPVFASDAISSTAYATDEILLVLLGQAAIGAAAWKYLSALAVVVCVLLTIVVLSYRQTIYAYPSGGGSYIVSKENLGTTPSLVANGDLSAEALKFSKGTNSLGLLLLLRAFSSGAVALSGVEAVSNGVPAFRKSESRNAALTIAMMGGVLGSCFLGTSILASHLRPYRGELDPTGLALMAQHIYGGQGVLFWIMQISTFAILILAANTAYADFPRLASIIGKDGFIPRQFANRGDRLVYSNGIVFLSVIASVLIVVFDGNVSKLIPLYAFGVFTGFTLSQAGMVRHHRRLQEPGWQWKAVVNAIGAIATGIIATVVVVSKFTQGAWIPAVLIPLMVALFKAINRHYRRLAGALRSTEDEASGEVTTTMVVLVGGLHRGTRAGVDFAKALQPDHLIAVHIAENEDAGNAFAERWTAYEPDVELDLIIDPYRNLRGVAVRFVDDVKARWDDDRVVVVIPEFVVHRWWEHLLHNQAALFLKGALLFKENVAVLSVPYQVSTPKGRKESVSL